MRSAAILVSRVQPAEKRGYQRERERRCECACAGVAVAHIPVAAPDPFLDVIHAVAEAATTPVLPVPVCHVLNLHGATYGKSNLCGSPADSTVK